MKRSAASRRPCDSCHSRNIKCDGQAPCHNCDAAELLCKWSTPLVLSVGLRIPRKRPAPAKSSPGRRTLAFGTDSDSDSETKASDVHAVQLLDSNQEAKEANTETTTIGAAKKRSSKAEHSLFPALLTGTAKPSQGDDYRGDLSSALESRRRIETATELDPSIYDYDGVYESLRPRDASQHGAAGIDRRPRYMESVMAAAEVRRRDALTAEEKKISREREAEGEEFAGKEKFVTEAYRLQQEENRRIEEEGRRREEEEVRRGEGRGMSAYYRKVLDREDRRHAEVVKATEELSRSRRPGNGKEESRVLDDEVEIEANANDENAEAQTAREINARGGAVALNEDGEVVDRRQLLRGGLNLAHSRKKGNAPGPLDSHVDSAQRSLPQTGPALVGTGGSRQAMIERQLRMLEAQLEQSLKRNHEVEEQKQEQLERAAKSRKSDVEISSARERYLQRKREADARATELEASL